MSDKKRCAEAGCERFVSCRGYCAKHYRLRWRAKEIALVQRPWGTAMEWLQSMKSFSSDECLDWPFTKYKGTYGLLRYEGRNQKASRVMCIVAHGEPPSPRHEAAHSCGVAGCVNPNHLRWATPKENQHDRIIHGTSNRGKRGKISADDVREIRSLASTMKQQEIAEMYGMHQSSISYIVNGKKTWLWLDDEQKVKT